METDINSYRIKKIQGIRVLHDILVVRLFVNAELRPANVSTAVLGDTVVEQ